MSYRLPPQEVQFYNFFCKYQADVVKYHMRRDIREAAGLGSPPSIFTTNSSESVNAELKRKVDFKECEWTDFNKHVEELVESQRDEIIRALSGRDQYRLLPQFLARLLWQGHKRQHHSISQWWNITLIQTTLWLHVALHT